MWWTAPVPGIESLPDNDRLVGVDAVDLKHVRRIFAAPHFCVYYSIAGSAADHC